MATGIEKLNKAARAAGFSMALMDDYAPQPKVQAGAPLPTSRAVVKPEAPRIVVRGSLVRHWLAGWAGKATAS